MIKKIFILLFLFICFFINADVLDDINVNTLDDINEWIYNNIKYKGEGGTSDIWQYPEETLELKTGDCEDQAFLFQYLAKKKLNIDVGVIWIYDNSIQFSHIVVVHDKLVYNPTTNDVYHLNEIACLYYVYQIILLDEVSKNIEEHRE